MLFAGLVKDSEYEAMTCDAAPYVSQMNPVHTRSCCLCKGADTVKRLDKIAFRVTLLSDGFRTEMLAVVSYGCKTWSLTLRKEHTLS